MQIPYSYQIIGQSFLEIITITEISNKATRSSPVISLNPVKSYEILANLTKSQTPDRTTL
jgi:hypothetical protein